MLVAAVARIKRPGCKADYMVIFEGPQDAGKSTAIEVLFSPWFSDDLAELGTKDASMQVRCAWGIEIAELASMTRSEIERVKAFITRKVDRFRPSYGRRVIEVPRQSIFIGSTNAESYLRDETGGRRFWPLRCGNLNLGQLRADKDQLWAEAVALFNAGCPWWLTDKDGVALAREQQEARRVPDEWEAPIAEFIDGRDSVTIGKILSEVFFIDKAKWTQLDQNRVARCLIVLGWRRGWRHGGRCYRPPTA
jgi:predicted P-loop ATPase